MHLDLLSLLFLTLSELVANPKKLRYFTDFSLSVETRRRYGWLRMMVFPGARLFPSPNLVPFGRVAARERQGALSRRAW